jgi:hypothetical protein
VDFEVSAQKRADLECADMADAVSSSFNDGASGLWIVPAMIVGSFLWFILGWSIISWI